VQARLVTEGAKSRATTPAEFGAFQRAEIAKWGKLIKEARIAVD
jgi:tripartite-type tricarboxylate transporter receptor subunit TctC